MYYFLLQAIFTLFTDEWKSHFTNWEIQKCSMTVACQHEMYLNAIVKLKPADTILLYRSFYLQGVQGTGAILGKALCLLAQRQATHAHL